MENRFKTNFAEYENKLGNIKVLFVYLCKQKNKHYEKINGYYLIIDMDISFYFLLWYGRTD